MKKTCSPLRRGRSVPGEKESIDFHQRKQVKIFDMVLCFVLIM